MNKKEYVLKLLDMIKDAVPLAMGFKLLIEKTEVNDNILDMLIHVFDKTIHQMHDIKAKEQLEKSKSFLMRLKDTEAQENEIDQQDLQHLDDMLADL